MADTGEKGDTVSKGVTRMIKLKGNTIYLTKGDTLDLKVNVLDREGNEFIPGEGDSFRFALKKDYTDKEPLILKEIPSDTLRLRLESEETKRLEVMKEPYVYDIQATLSDGTVDTFIDRQKLFITEEVE